VTPSLRTRRFLGTGLVVAAALGVVVVFVAREQRAWLLARNADHLGRVAALLARDPALQGAAEGETPDWSARAASAAEASGCRVTLIAADGRVLGDSDVPRERVQDLENHGDRTEVRDALAGRPARSVRRSATLGRELLYVAVPVPGDTSRRVAVLRLAEPLEVVNALQRSLVRLTLVAAALALLVSLALVYALADREAKRIRALEGVATRLGAGEAGVRAHETPADELGDLGRAVNRMASELRARVEALERERDEREHILAHMSDGVALIDASGRIVRVNHSLARLLGAPLPAAPGMAFAEFARSPDLVELLESSRRVNHGIEVEVRLWVPRQRLVRATATPLRGTGRDAVLLVLHDLSEVEMLNRVRQDFVANVSHELRTPLTSLRGYAETLLEGGLDDAEHRAGFVAIIRDQAARLETLVEDLLSLAELERPGAELTLESIDLHEVAERQADVFRQRAERAGLALGPVEGVEAPIVADRVRVEQVLANLLDNAIKYTERGGIRVVVGTDVQGVWCEVADTGPGIPAEDQPRVFERFYRVDKARSRAKGGTGLGLSIVKHIVTLHGGEVAVRSTPGGGSVFRFTLPRRGGPH
jgi:two-component system phosphate regulon sensor histidine kinase PhoR